MHILAQDIAAPFNVPGHDNSAMDGFACRTADLDPARGQDAVTLPIAGAAFAGAPHTGPLPAGACIKIMTGGKVPPDCDIVIPQEETTLEQNGAAVRIAAAPRPPGQHIRRAGEDLRAGAPAAAAGDLITPAHVGLLASLGIQSVPVRRRLRVAFFSTGDEVRAIGEPLQDSEVYDSNRHTLRAMITRMHFTPVDFGIIPDDPTKLAAAIDAASATADAIISSGGASVGEADHIRAVLATRGEVRFWKIAMRPGRPLAYGKAGGIDFFGLPGNPVSVMVCFYQFVREALWRLAGRAGDLSLPPTTAITATDLKKAKGRTEYQRGILTATADGTLQVTATGDQGSGILSSMTRGNCFIILPEDTPPVKAGTPVAVQPFEGLL